MVYKNNKKGAQGIGTLIIFIALILVAAVAAGVLISTVGKLQGKAETTGSEIQQRLGTGFSVFEVVANNTNDSFINSTTDRIAISLQLSPGSDPIKLSDITTTIVTKSGSDSYIYSGSTAYNQTHFGVTEIKGDATDNYLNREDVVTIELTLSSQINDIGENEEFTIRLFPGVGNPLPIKVVTPPAMTNKLTVLK